MTSELSETIQRVVARIRNFRSLYEQNEMATRSQVVDPILRCLGWDTEDPKKVQPNVSSEDGTPDYTLILDGRKVLFVEAKRMSVDLIDRQVLSHLAKDCFAQGMSYGIVTNGAIWVFFRAFQEGTRLTVRVVWKTNIEHDDIDTITRKLRTVAIQNIPDIDSWLSKIRIFDQTWQSLPDNIDRLTEAIVPLFLSMAKEKYGDFDFSHEELADFVQERLVEVFSHHMVSYETVLDETRFSPDDSMMIMMMTIERDTFPVRYSYEILVNTAEWLVKKGKLRREDCPIPAGHKRNLVNTEPKHRFGDEFRAPKKLSNGLYIETHFGRPQCITHAIRLLEHFGFDRNLIKLYYP